MEKSVHAREYAVLLKLLRETRRVAGVTQVQLAERVGESESHLSKMEQGEVRLDLIQPPHQYGLSTNQPNFAKTARR